MNIVVGLIGPGTPEAAGVLRRASAADHAHAASRRSPAGREATLLARALARALLAEIGGHEDWTIASDDRGKPYAFSVTGEPGPAISLSHTRGLVAAAVADGGLLGIDAERHRPRPSFDDLAAYAFGPAERAEASAQGRPGFYRIWTLREAMSKATGDGLRLAADRCDRVDGGPMEGHWSCWQDARHWHLAHLFPEADYSLAVALATARSSSVSLRWSILNEEWPPW